MKKTVLICLLIFTLVGGFFRVINLAKNPVSLSIDEVAFGYSAYSILKTAHDEHGVFMPLSFKSTGDYKNPVPIYLMVPFIWLLGLNEFSIRLPDAFLGTFSIPLFYFLFVSLIKNKKIALIGSFLTAISAWHIYFSRYAYDGLTALFLVVLGVIFLLRIFSGKIIYPILAAFFLILSMYTYYTERIFVPLLVLAFLIINRSRAIKEKKYSAALILSCLLFVSPLLCTTIFGSDSTRLNMVFLSKDIDYIRYVLLDHHHPELLLSGLTGLLLKPLTLFSNENILLFFFWVKRYLNYFEPGFVFFYGLGMTTAGSLGLGLLYIFELPWLILGIVELITKHIFHKKLIFLWIILGVVPASIANNEQHPGRVFLMMPALILVVAIGANRFFNWYLKIKNQLFKQAFGLIFGLIVIQTLIQAFLVFHVHYPNTLGEAFMEGTKESVLYVLENQHKYKRIIFDPYRGVLYGDIYNIPDVYLLFYSKYDPATFQKYGLSREKYLFRPINSGVDGQPGTLLIGSPWSLSIHDLKPNQILKKIYLTNGNLALLIVDYYGN